MSLDRDALSRVARRIRRSEKDRITQKEAEKIVARQLEIAERKTNNRS